MRKARTVLGYILFFLILIPTVVSLIVYRTWNDIFSPSKKEYGDVLTFWGTYLGALLAVGGIYWQVRTENKNAKKREIQGARPVFTISYDSRDSATINPSIRAFTSDITYIGDLEDTYDKNHPRNIGNEGFILFINNPSMQPLLFVKIKVTYLDDFVKLADRKREEFFIGRIREGEEIQCVPYQFIYNHLIAHGISSKFFDEDKLLPYLPLIQKVEVYYTTTKGEKFKRIYSKKDKYLRLKLQSTSKLDSGYDLSQFEESPFIILADYGHFKFLDQFDYLMFNKHY